ncbi:MAG TPA: oxygen-independent coproporphyrinogen III oxidase [Kofleriaceae bacterium]|jgi:oxygen-independent coproporphyrinogen-3 oxidase|nr:oxygen-independent coproporphyrinogen III oxidase [Kofleriaceae bacterium]
MLKGNGLRLTATELAAHVRAGPRYTSYPPATELDERFGPAEAAAQLDQLRIDRPDAAVSLYCHIPFCTRLCWYCGCNVVVTRDRSRATGYIDDLLAEIDLVAARAGRGRPLAELALGGGSPNFLAAEDLARLMAGIAAAFTIQPDAELGLELDPRDTRLDEVAAMAALGFRRLSMGVQDFDPEVQRRINRHQSEEQTWHLVQRARHEGFTSVNIDLIYGLPGQTSASTARTIQAVAAMNPEQVAVFGYAHLPHLRRHQKLVERDGALPDAAARAELLLVAVDELERAGYQRIGLDHFARPDAPLARAARTGKLHRNFQGYVVRHADHLLACGVTGISDVGDACWQNHGDVDKWAMAVRAGVLPAHRGIALDRDDRLRRWVITRLMCDGTLDFGAVERRFGICFEDYFAGQLDRLAGGDSAALVCVDRQARVLRATPLGNLLIRNVAMVFDRYLDRAAAAGTGPRFSQSL